MDEQTRRIVEDGVAASHAGTRSFGEIVGALAAAGIESYRVDYRERTSTYFAKDGSFHVVPVRTPETPVGDAFDADAIVEAIRGSQNGRVLYPEFMHRSMAAGCVGYITFIAGRNVTYFGRRGETHVEHFPSARS